MASPSHDMVLIETLWNVNKFDASTEKYTVSINRNIVECK